MTAVLLLQPPALKASEPPLSLAVLSAALRNLGLSVTAIDANLEAYLFLLDEARLAKLTGENPSTSIRRAFRHRQESLALLRSPAAGKSFARYCTAVRYLNQLLSLWGESSAAERLTLGDYQNNDFSVFDPEDLRQFSIGDARTLFRDYFQEQLLPQIIELEPKLIAVSINYLHQALPAFELAGLLKRQFPTTTLVAGGGLITSWQEPLRDLDLRLPPFDHLVFGPGESPLTALTTGKAAGDYFLADAGQIGFFPDFKFARLGNYLSPQPVLPVSTSRGCYWQNCLFCPEAAAPVHPYTSSQPDQIVDLLLNLEKQYEVHHFHLTDNAIPVNILRSLASRAGELRHLSWFGFVRFEPLLKDLGLVRQLAQSGCRMLQLGLESGSQRVLDRLRKGVQLATAIRILNNLHAAGIYTYVYIMLGTPGETAEDAELTLAFLEEHAEKISFLNLAIMNLPRSSGLLDNPQQYGITESNLQDEKGTLGLYHQFETVGNWDRAAARRFLVNRLQTSPKIREIIQRTPPLFTSNHAFFFANNLSK